nr:putative membane protein [uncultured bacterium]
MKITALYSAIYSVRGITRTAAKLFAWIFGVQLAVLYGLATVADAPLTSLAGPGLRFGLALVAFVFAPRVFDAVLARISARYRRA